MENKAKELFAFRKEKILETLGAFLLREENKALLRLPWIDDLPEKLLEYTAGGKCLRGNLVILGAELAGEKPVRFYPAAAALELFQSGILMHDDIIDGDEMRRGKPSAHKAFAAALKNDKAGEAMAVCLGDIALMLTFALLNETDCAPERLREATVYWGREFAHVGAAEMEDAYLSLNDILPGEERIMALYEGKTAGYTFVVPLTTGLILGGAGEELRKAVARYALALGVLFQIQDDELGLFGDERALGKPVGSDIRENKKTIFWQKLMESATAKEMRELKRIFGSQNLSAGEIDFVRELVEEKGIRKETDLIKEKLSFSAREALKAVPPGNNKEIMEALIEISLKRKA